MSLLGNTPPALSLDYLDQVDLCKKINLMGSKPFLPFYALVTRITFNGQIFNYFGSPYFDVNNLTRYITIRNNVQKITAAFSGRNVCVWTFSKKSYFIFRGSLFNFDNVPLLLHVYDTQGKEVIFMNTLLVLEPSYATLYKKLMKDVISLHIRKGIEVHLLSTSQINENTLEEITPVRKFASFMEQEAFMNTSLPFILSEDYEDTYPSHTNTIEQVQSNEPIELEENIEILLETSTFTLTE